MPSVLCQEPIRPFDVDDSPVPFFVGKPAAGVFFEERGIAVLDSDSCRILFKDHSNHSPGCIHCDSCFY